MGNICSDSWKKTDPETMRDLCDKLLNKGFIISKNVYNSMLEVDRKDFCPYFPYENRPQSLNYNVTISAPSIHAYCLELLKDYLTAGVKALDIGFGSGYITVALSKMMEDKGLVIGIEHIKELCDLATENISKNHKNLLESKKIILIEGDGRFGYEKYGPYNCIHVGAASEEIPQALIDQLDKGGRLVIPIGNLVQYIYVIDKDMNGKISKNKKKRVLFVPLTSIEDQLNY